MPLVSGTKLGPYDIVNPLGAGGMGEVYRARDTRLGRDVALKVLPEAFASDPERMVRFEREAKVLASLNHTNIAHIYGLEESSGTRALVMELIEGPTLAERIKQGPLPLDEVLPIAKQIAEGLEYAHERGIIHRDLKPSNIKLTPDGQVKILDFGLAKALEPDPAAVDISSSPTISHMATQAGIILGTAAYMSPEQAKGKAVDRRADIWAFGCVLYEMLTGKSAFDGETVTDVLAAVVRAEPEWAALPPNTPLRVHHLLRRCLTKDPRQRLRDIGEARIIIEQTLTGTPDAAEIAGQAKALLLQGWRRALPWVTAALLAVIATAIGGYIARSPKPAEVVVAQISPPENMNFALTGNFAGPPVLSPDGRKLAFAAVGSDGKQRLWVRSLGTGTAQAFEGTEGATFPFWSPDSRSLGFFAQGKLNRIEASGGPAVAISDAPDARGGAWSTDGTILYTPSATSPLYRVPATGGAPQQVTKLDASRLTTSHRWPQFLPDGKHFLFYAVGAGGQNNVAYARSLDGGEPKPLIRNDSNAVYAESGYLLFTRQGTLIAQRFDADSLRLFGEAIPLAEHAESDQGPMHGIFSVSENGVLTYVQGGPSDIYRLLWYDRSGKQISETGTPSGYRNACLSPDGRKLAVTVREPDAPNAVLWVYDLTGGSRTRLTFSAGFPMEPAWSPDGQTIAYISDKTGVFHLYQNAADGTGETTALLVDDVGEFMPTWSADGRYLIFGRHTTHTMNESEIWALPLFGDRKPFVVVPGPQFHATDSALSPNMKWLAYRSTESGRPEIYVVPFLHGTGKWEVSTSGGALPRWRRDGKELFFLSPDNKLMSAEISEQGPAVSIGRAAPLFQTNAVAATGWTYDVAGDGRKFVVVTQAAQQTTGLVTLVVNWPALLKKE